MLMRHDLNGWHEATGAEVEDMKKNGWRESSYKEHSEEILKKLELKYNAKQSKDVSEGNTAAPSGESSIFKRRGRPKGV